MKSLAILVFLTIILFSSCTVAKFGGHSSVPICLNQSDVPARLIKHIIVKKHRAFDYTHYYDMSNILNNKIMELRPDLIANTTLTVKHNIGNFFFNMLTLGLANSQMIIVEGDFMKRK